MNSNKKTFFTIGFIILISLSLLFMQCVQPEEKKGEKKTTSVSSSSSSSSPSPPPPPLGDVRITNATGDSW